MSAPAAARALGRSVAATDPLGGGDISTAERVVLDNGTSIFVKSQAHPPPGFFAAEARGLEATCGIDGLNVPRVLAIDDGWIALEWIERGRGDAESWEALGRGLAELHLRGAEEFGAQEDGFIGTVPQENGPEEGWPAFYGERRILAMTRIAIDRGGLDAAAGSESGALVDRIGDLCGPPEPPAQLHGDLWSGNAMIDTRGRPWIIDPAAYGGHREVDLAMMRLFGGFPESSFAAYDEVHPLAVGHEDRVALYQLFPLLVHAALFGGGYGGRARSIIRSYL